MRVTKLQSCVKLLGLQQFELGQSSPSQAAGSEGLPHSSTVSILLCPRQPLCHPVQSPGAQGWPTSLRLIAWGFYTLPLTAAAQGTHVNTVPKSYFLWHKLCQNLLLQANCSWSWAGTEMYSFQMILIQLHKRLLVTKILKKPSVAIPFWDANWDTIYLSTTRHIWMV